MACVNRLGFTQLAGGESAGSDERGSGTVNVIFVHGLRGHPQETWTSRGRPESQPPAGASKRRLKSIFKTSSTHPDSGSSTFQEGSTLRKEQVFWPQDYLADDIAQARVWTYGYDADVIGGLFRASGKDSVSQHGRNLAVRLEREVDNEDPIIFVAHSLGGILVKDAIRRSEASRQRTKLIVFLGTPHRGSGMAGWGPVASNLACLALQDSHKKIIETLEVDSEVLDNIHEQFILAISQHDIRVHSFQEGQGISGVIGLHGKVVNDFSSKLDQPAIETVESINANHMQMARCWNRSDESYRAIAGVLKQFLKSARSETSLPVRTVTHKQQEGTLGAQQAVDTPSTSTSYCNLPSRNRRFIGRTEKLEELEKRLLVKNYSQKLALVGLGGVGKTQVALELAYRVKDRWPDCSIFWLPAVSKESFEQACQKIISDCSIRFDPTVDEPKESVKKYLSGDRAGKWFLIVDNADDQEILFGTRHESQGLADYLPENENGLIFFTTRHGKIAVELAGKQVVDLQSMTAGEAECFLRKSLIREEMLQDSMAMAELLTELTFLPLAIAQAAAYLNTIEISLREYISLLNNTEEDAISLLSREFRDETRYKGTEAVKNAIATTWLISFNHIRRSDPDAADLLLFMSCIEHKAIPRRLLPEMEPAERTSYAFGILRAYAFLTRQENGEIYDLHRLVHLATRIWLREQGSTVDVNRKFIVHLAKTFPSHDYSNRFIWREYFPHVFRLLENTKDLDIELRYLLCLYVGQCLQVDGRIKEAVRWLWECFSWVQRHFPEDNPKRLISQGELAKAYYANGQIKKALELFEHLIIIEKEIKAKDHPDQLALQYHLAKAYLANGQVQEAVELLEYVVKISKELLTEDHASRLASSQYALAGAYQANGQVKAAVELFEHIVTIRKVLAEDHPSRLASQHGLAGAYLANGQVEAAVELLEDIVKKEEVLAEDHASRLASQHELATAYMANGQVKAAVELLEHIVTIQKVLAEDHPFRLTSQCNLAVVYEANGQTKKAVELLEHVVKIRKEGLAEDHPDRLASEYGLATVYQANGRIKQAVKLLEPVVEIRKKVLTENHPDRLASERALLNLYISLLSEKQTKETQSIKGDRPVADLKNRI